MPLTASTDQIEEIVQYLRRKLKSLAFNKHESILSDGAYEPVGSIFGFLRYINYWDL